MSGSYARPQLVPQPDEAARVAIIPTNGRECLKECVEAIQHQVDKVLLVYGGPRSEEEPPAYPVADFPVRSTKINSYWGTIEYNISSWWTEGLVHAEALVADAGATDWYAAILNDDAIVPPGWFDRVLDGMVRSDAVAGCSGAHDVVLRVAEQVPLDYRMQGFAFILKGTSVVRPNENLHWYFTDDYIDWESRRAGGMAMVSGPPVVHLHPNGQMNGHLQELVARDAGRFMDLYGKMPW